MAVRATQGFAVAGKNRHRVINRGDVFDRSDPVVKGREHLFEDVDEVIERATAGPGERRSTPKRNKPTIKKGK